MKFTTPLIEAELIRRHSRFLADVKLNSGKKITAHTSNTGSMKGCCDPGSRVWLSLSSNPKRKYQHTWEIIQLGTKTNVGINTLRANHLVREGIELGIIKELQGYDRIQSEVKYGGENSRIDFLLTGKRPSAGNPLSVTNKPDTSNARGRKKRVAHADKGSGSRMSGQLCYVEVKNVTLVEEQIAYFPDAVSARGTKHLRELQQMVEAGNRAVMFYCLQRSDAREVRPAELIDPVYTKALRTAVSAGVEAIAYYAEVTAEEITLKESIPVNVG